MAWSWTNNPITNTVKAGYRGTKNLAVKYVVNPTAAAYKKVEKETKEHVIEPINKHVVTPIKETADGIRQDPAAFAKDMKDGAKKSVDKVAQVIYE